MTRRTFAALGLAAGLMVSPAMGADGGFLTTHVLDTYTGTPAAGMTIDFYAKDGEGFKLVKSMTTNVDGRTDAPVMPKDAFKTGSYQLVFHVAEYFAKIGAKTASPAFLDLVPIQFTLADGTAHYHVPLLTSPWSYSTYRAADVSRAIAVPNDDDARFMRAAIAASRSARDKGNGPFGAVLVSGRGEPLLTAENTAITAKDCTAHAETNLVRQASACFEADELRSATLYASGEPCPMCAGAIFYSGIGRVVFAVSQARMALIPGLPKGLQLPVRDVLACGAPQTTIEGPFLDEEAIAVLEGG